MQSSSRPTPKPKAPTWHGPGPMAVFVRNLRLLGLDKQADWPDITAQSFSAAQQNSRFRIQAVEWSLYHLFRLWDPVEAHNKLRPFFPALEPLQSVNLRAALFRVLSDLKKNGFLGREAVLRKTMLDECKGEKFEETLATFSTAVLRRHLPSMNHVPGDSTFRISTSSRPTVPDQDALLPLVLAHRAALTALLEEKRRLVASNDTHDTFLRSTLEVISKRAEDISAPSEEESKKVEETRHDIANSWVGEDNWRGTVLGGGGRVSTNPLLEASFAHAWSIVKAGGSLNDIQSAGSTDLLENLKCRLDAQQSRLQKWKEFRRSLAAETREASVKQPRKSVSSPLFREHQGLSVSNNKREDVGSPLSPPQDEEYQTLIAEMKSSLDNVPASAGQPTKPESHILRTTKVDPYLDIKPAPSTQRGESTELLRESHSPMGSPLSSSFPVSSTDDSASFPRQEPVEALTPQEIQRSNTPSIIIDAESAVEPEETNESHVSDTTSPHRMANSQGGPATLTERTTQSMSLLSAPRSSRPKQPRQSQRYPTTPFETPEKTPEDNQRPGAVTPQEELFSQDADYASVFKSRPKIATSPVNSPTVHVSPFGDAEEPDADTDDMDEFPLNVSPLAMRQKRRF